MQGYFHDLHAEDARGVSSTSYPETFMATRLNDADRRAVDSLLEGGGGTAATAQNPSGQAELQFQQRVSAAKRWLDLLGAMPAEEPAPTLVASILARVQRTPGAAASGAPTSASVSTRI